MIVLSVMEKIEQDKGTGSVGVEGLVWRRVVPLSVKGRDHCGDT